MFLSSTVSSVSVRTLQTVTVSIIKTNKGYISLTCVNIHVKCTLVSFSCKQNRMFGHSFSKSRNYKNPSSGKRYYEAYLFHRVSEVGLRLITLTVYTYVFPSLRRAGNHGTLNSELASAHAIEVEVPNSPTSVNKLCSLSLSKLVHQIRSQLVSLSLSLS